MERTLFVWGDTGEISLYLKAVIITYCIEGKSKVLIVSEW